MSASNTFYLRAKILAAAFGLFVALLPSDSRADGYALITAEEFASRTSKVRTRALTSLASEGPEIIVHAPERSGELRSPLDFDVEFRPREAEPDMDTLKVEYDLGWFWKDVTSRMADHAEISSNRIVSRGAELPAGNHHLRLSISDQAGKTTATEIAFTVAED
jgi:hypothetical protein